VKYVVELSKAFACHVLSHLNEHKKEHTGRKDTPFVCNLSLPGCRCREISDWHRQQYIDDQKLKSVNITPKRVPYRPERCQIGSPVMAAPKQQGLGQKKQHVNSEKDVKDPVICQLSSVPWFFYLIHLVLNIFLYSL
jgi:hypothetical protein